MRRGLLFALCLLAPIPCARNAAAAVIYVNSTATGTPHDGSTWNRAFLLVQDGINAAAANDEVWVAAGTYTQTLTLKKDVSVYGGFAGTETARTQRNARANITFLDGNLGGRVVTCPAGLTNTTVLDGFTISNGKSTYGAGVYIQNGSPVISNNIIADNTSTDTSWGGGGIFIESGASPTIQANLVTRNTAYDAGGIYCYRDTSRIVNNVISLNNASHWGGGVRTNGSSAVIANNTFIGNYAAGDAGTIRFRDGGAPTFANNILTHNSSGLRVDDSNPRLRFNAYFENAGYNFTGVTVTTANGNVFADPKLSVDRRGLWHIAPTSPCKDRGDGSLVATGDTDIDGQARVQGSAVDIGADESDGSVPPPWAIHVMASGDDTNDGFSWDHPLKNIQTGITVAARTGGEVWVASETYTETITLPASVQVYGGFAGTETARSERDWKANPTVIDGNKGGSTVTFAAGVARNTVLDGFTITNGQALSGGGVYANGASGTLRHCFITGNNATENSGDGGGGGVMAHGGSMLIANCVITHNNSVRDGGGIYLWSDATRLVDCSVSYNTAGNRGWGGAVFIYYSSAVLANNTFATNIGSPSIYYRNSTATMANNIVAFNYTGISQDYSSPRLRYNCVFGNNRYQYSNITDPTGTDGNIQLDPMIVSDMRGAYHIGPLSPCKDAGDNSVVLLDDTDIDGQARIQGGRVDIGADESDGTTPIPVIIRVRSDGNDANDGSTWAKAKRRVQAGADAASVTGGEVWVAAGTYYGTTVIPAGVRVYGGFAGSETALSQRDFRANVTVLDANKGGAAITLTDGGSRDTVVDGFTLTNGQAPRGGGVNAVASAAAVRNCLIISNTATDTSYGGGGVYIESGTGTFLNNTIRNNTSARDGGGIYVYGGSPRIASCTISSNYASRLGGGIEFYGSNATAVNCTLTGNQSGTGGGALEFESGGSPQAVNCVIAFNGSGLRTDSGAVPRLRFNNVYGNTAYDYHSSMSDPTGIDGNVDWNPMLVMDARGNPHLAPTSPCVNAGDNSVVVSGDTDIDGQARIQNTFVDLGADESDGTTPQPMVVFVKTNGNDTNDGLTWATAKKRVQAAVDVAALSGGEVWVMKGTYTGLLTLPFAVQVYGGFAGTESKRDARDYRKNVTILDANKGGSVVSITGGAGPDTVLDGFTLRNGTGSQYDSRLVGGGVYIASSSPTIRNNTITGNSVATGWEYGGGGIFATGGWPQILSNTIRGNTSSRSGGGIYLNASNARVANNTIAGNTATHNGGGIYARASSSAYIANNTIYNNTSGDEGGGAAVWDSANASFVNNIIVLNSSGLRSDSADPRFRYNDVWGNVYYNWSNLTDPTGTDGNISVDPQVATDSHGDLHIAPSSPCRNAGDNAAVYVGDTDIDGEARIQDGRVDIGADESTGALPPVPVIRVKPDGDDLKDGSSWANAKRRLQPAIDAVATTGGEVWVARGTYVGTITLPVGVQVYGGFAATETARDQRDWTANETILDGNKAGSVVSVSGSQGRDTVLDGFTITNGTGSQWDSRPVGGGIFISNAQPTIRHNIIKANTASGSAYGGAGLFCYGSSAAPLIQYNVFRENVATNAGGAIYSQACNPVIADNLFVLNRSANQGGAIFMWNGGSPLIANNTVVDNTSGANYGALDSQDGGTAPTYVNNIVAFNNTGIRAGASTDPRLRYNCVFGNTTSNYKGITDPTGTDGNISVDPLFVDRAGGNYTLGGASPCIDMGDDTQVGPGDTDLAGNPRIHGLHVDMGAYEVSLAFTILDAAKAMRVAGGLLSVDSAERDRLNASTVAPSQTSIDILDALAIVRMLSGK